MVGPTDIDALVMPKTGRRKIGERFARFDRDRPPGSREARALRDGLDDPPLAAQRAVSLRLG